MARSVSRDALQLARKISEGMADGGSARVNGTIGGYLLAPHDHLASNRIRARQGGTFWRGESRVKEPHLVCRAGNFAGIRPQFACLEADRVGKARYGGKI